MTGEWRISIVACRQLRRPLSLQPRSRRTKQNYIFLTILTSGNQNFKVGRPAWRCPGQLHLDQLEGRTKKPLRSLK